TQLHEPWRNVAADVDKSGQLTDNDLFLIRAMILGEIKQFETGNWKFLPKSLTDTSSNPATWMNCPEYIDLVLSQVLPMHKNDFKAVELGKLYVQTISQTRDRNITPA